MRRWISWVRPPICPRARLALAALGAGARQHRVLGGDPAAPPLPRIQPGTRSSMVAAQMTRVSPTRISDRALGELDVVRHDLHRTQLVGRATVRTARGGDDLTWNVDSTCYRRRGPMRLLRDHRPLPDSRAAGRRHLRAASARRSRVAGDGRGARHAASSLVAPLCRAAVAWTDDAWPFRRRGGPLRAPVRARGARRGPRPPPAAGHRRARLGRGCHRGSAAHPQLARPTRRAWRGSRGRQLGAHSDPGRAARCGGDHHPSGRRPRRLHRAAAPHRASRALSRWGGSGEGLRIARALADTLRGPGLEVADPIEVPALLAAHDVLLVPSRAEAFGIAAAEAIAAGRWVVAADVGGLREVVTDGLNGTLVADGDYAGAIARVPDYDPAAVAATAARFDVTEQRRAMAAGLGRRAGAALGKQRLDLGHHRIGHDTRAAKDDDVAQDPGARAPRQPQRAAGPAPRGGPDPGRAPRPGRWRDRRGRRTRSPRTRPPCLRHTRTC